MTGVRAGNPVPSLRRGQASGQRLAGCSATWGRAVHAVAAGWCASYAACLNSKMLKTRVAHGYCSRHQAADACPYANICTTCDNFITGPEFTPALRDQLTDVRRLHADAQSRGWDSEAARHAHVGDALADHLSRLEG
jgi:hypothetical protein